MPVFPSTSKRTRSQLTLPEFNFKQLGRSPLKEARTAHRNTQHPTPPSSQLSNVIEADPKLSFAEETALALAERGKRASSPLKETQPAKRRKQDGSDSENQSSNTPSPAMNSNTHLPSVLDPTIPSITFSNVHSSPSKHNISQHHDPIPLLQDISSTGTIDHGQVLHSIPEPHLQDNLQYIPLAQGASAMQQHDSEMTTAGTNTLHSSTKGHDPVQDAKAAPVVNPFDFASLQDLSVSGSATKTSSTAANSPAPIPFIDFNRMPPSPSKIRRLDFVAISPSNTGACSSRDFDISMAELTVRSSPPSSPTLPARPSSPSPDARATPSSIPPEPLLYTPMSPLTPVPSSSPQRTADSSSSRPQTPSPLPPSSKIRDLDSNMTDDDPTPRPIQRIANMEPHNVSTAPSRPKIPSPGHHTVSRPTTPSKRASEARSRPVTPPASTSRLPRPSIAPGTRPPERQPPTPGKSPDRPQEKAKKPRSKGKARAAAPLGGRMTRSQALRQQEIRRKEEIKASGSSKSSSRES